MKRFQLFYFFLFLLSYLGCKQSPKMYTIGVSQCSSDEWRDKMNTEMFSEAASIQNLNLICRSANDDTEKQIADIQYFIDQKVDLLIITPNKTAPMTPIIEQIYDLGIPVVLVDRKILSDKYTAFIGADNYQIGQQVGTYLVKLLGGQGNVVEILGLDGSSSALERHQGFINIVSEYPDINIIYQGDGAWLKEGGENQMRKAFALAANINLPIHAVFAQNDRMAKGAYAVTPEQNLLNKLYFIGIDALPGPEEGIDWVLQNKLHATFIYPTGGDKVIELAMAILDKKAYKKNNTLTTAVVDQTNAKVLKLQTDQINDLQVKINFLNKRVDAYLGQYLTQRYILYAIMGIVCIFFIVLLVLYKSYKFSNQLNTQLSASNLEINEQKITLETQRDQLLQLSIQLEEATQAKINFFTNISHEFRTPLTLIAGPIDYLRHQLTVPVSFEKQHQLLNLVQKNVKILLRLVDQILDFRSIEAGKESINYSKTDLLTLLHNWNQSFTDSLLTKSIKFSFNVETMMPLIGFFDVEKLERIYFNLLSNAFKFTPPDGDIWVIVDWDRFKNQVCLSVNNTGTLTDEQMEHIFDRFYRIDKQSSGSGIGLSLVKAMVQLHCGTINVSSINNSITFNIYLPLSIDESKNDESKNVSSNYLEEQLNSYEDKLAVHFHDKNSIHILVVDDNVDVRIYIRTILTSKNQYNKYTLLEASDGDQAFLIAMNEDVDIIISDIMMPNRDGISLCRLLKQTHSTSHIPIILLTACTLDEQRILGFESGADAYIPKPFNAHILEVRIRKMIENKNRIAHYFKYNTTSEMVEIKINSIDQSLVNKLKEFILINITNSSINVEELSRTFALSRTQFYRKIKAITSLSPNEFIRSVRLQEAYKLLQSNKNVAEVAYEVGFTSPSYFTKCFKEYFDKNPSDIKA